MSVNPAAASPSRNSSSVSAPAMQPGPLRHVGARGVVHARAGDDVGDGEPAARPSARGRPRAGHLRLVAGEVQDAVGDDDIDRAVGQRDLLDVALDELDVLHPRLRRVRRASASISSVMSRPIAFRLGPTRRAEMSTSAPAPEPRSSTVSPSCRSATAVGTPHPSEAFDRCGGRVGSLLAVERAAETLLAGVGGVEFRRTSSSRRRPRLARGGRVLLADRSRGGPGALKACSGAAAARRRVAARLPQQPSFSEGSQQEACVSAEQQD